MSDQLAINFPAPAARRSDQNTSHLAKVIAITNSAANRRLVLRALYEHGPLSDFDLERITGVQQTSIGKRRGDCVEAGLVVRAFRLDPLTFDRVADDGVSPSNSPCARWELTPAGRDFVCEHPEVLAEPFKVDACTDGGQS